MPRVKRNRANQTKRKRPALPDGDPETSMSQEERAQKLENYLQDFDTQVKARVEQMKSQAKSIISSIKAVYHLELMKIPPHVRKMKLSEFYALGGKIDTTALEGVSKAVTGIADAVFQNAPNSTRLPFEDKTNVVPMQTPAQSTTKKPGRVQKKTVVTEPVSAGRTLRSTSKRKNVASSTSCKSQIKQQKNRDTSAMPPQTTVGRSTRINNQFVTPACQMQSIAQTPFVTPKFDPSLPLTPSVLRDPRFGERIMSMSGSPLANVATPSHTVQVSVPMGDGQSLQFTTDNTVSASHVPQLNDQARKNLELLQEQLSLLLKDPTKQ